MYALQTQTDVWVEYLDGSGPTPFIAAFLTAVVMAGVVMSFLERAVRRVTAL